MAEHFGRVGMMEKSLCSIDGSLYLFGNVVRASKLPKKGNANVVAYYVQWEDIVLEETKIDLQVVVPAIELSVWMWCKEKLIGRKMILPRKKYGPENLFDDDVVKSLFVFHEGEDGASGPRFVDSVVHHMTQCIAFQDCTFTGSNGCTQHLKKVITHSPYVCL
jgi:hypothetical protein